jgi:cytochrome c5
MLTNIPTQLQDANPRHLQLRRAIMFKPFLLLSAVVFFEIAVTPSRALPPQATHPKPAAKAPVPSGPTPAQIAAQGREKAKKLYSIDCALCHGDSGDGKTDVAKDMQLTLGDWSDPKTLAGKQDQELFDIIRKGKDKMPPEAEGRATDDEVKHLILYIRSLAKQQPAAPAAAAPAAEPAAAPATPPAAPPADTPPAPNQ